MTTISLANQIKCVKREIAMREKVYPRRVYAQQMDHDVMRYEIDAMTAVLHTLMSVSKQQTNVRT